VTAQPARPAPRRSRKVELLRAGWGAALVVAPDQVMSNVHGLHVDRKSITVVRILGARHLIQAALSGLRPSPDVLAMGVWIDAVHALTALGLAVLDKRRARAGLTDAAFAGLWAGAGYHDLTSAQFPVPAHQLRRDRLARMVLGVVPGGGTLLSKVVEDRNTQTEGNPS
jgi:hypothetical protein